MEGKAVHIIKRNPDSNIFELDDEPLKKLLCNERSENCEIAVISVAGPLRKGKSFLLSLFVRFLLKGSSEDWLDDLDEKFDGFDWKNGADAHTTGLLIWSEIFYYKKSDGKEIGIILMDTQGCFDNKTTMQDNVAIFALSTMLSSVQIYNLMQVIAETDLQNLQLFSEFGKFAATSLNGEPFQKLLFLIRDWSGVEDYGEASGQKYLEKTVLEKSLNNELAITRDSIKSCFHDLNCYLMPHPSLKVARDFNGDLNLLEPDFVKHIKKLVPMVLSKEKIIVKQSNGQAIKARDLVDYIHAYWIVFENEKMPEAKTIYISMVEANCSSVCRTVQKSYTTKMDDFVSQNESNKFSEIYQTHKSLVDEAKKEFIDKTGFGNDSLKKPFLDELLKYFGECFTNYIGVLESKNEKERQAFMDKLQNLKDTAQNGTMIEKLNEMSTKYTKLVIRALPDNPIVAMGFLATGVMLKTVSKVAQGIEDVGNDLKDSMNIYTTDHSGGYSERRNVTE